MTVAFFKFLRRSREELEKNGDLALQNDAENNADGARKQKRNV